MDTKGHCFPKSIIIQAVYFKLRFSLSYRGVEEIMKKRGVEVDHATIQRWVFKFMPEIDIQMRRRKKIAGMRRTLTGIEIVHMMRKNQLNTQEQSMFKSFYSLAV